MAQLTGQAFTIQSKNVGQQKWQEESSFVEDQANGYSIGQAFGDAQAAFDGVRGALVKRLALLVALFASLAHAGVILEGSTDALELVTSAAGSIDYNCSWANVTATALTTPGTTKGNINTATTTTVIAAPSASNFRHIRACSFHNASTTVANTVTLQRDVSATKRLVWYGTLAPKESAILDETGLMTVYTSVGTRKIDNLYTSGFTGGTEEFYKVGTAAEAVGVKYAYLKDSGTPGAWVPGTPGLNGATVDCSTAAGATVAGAPTVENPASGSLFLTRATTASSVAHPFQYGDLQWYNTGIVVTTTTNQAITFPTPVSRDDNGSNLGAGISAGIYVTTATTNAGAITNMTMTYTNEQGTGSRTATIASFPATAVVGTLVEFQLQAGDHGVRSIQGITLGTSLVTGAVSLVTFRALVGLPIVVANIGASYENNSPGLRIYNGTCFFPRYTASATTATTMSGILNTTEK